MVVCMMKYSWKHGCSVLISLQAKYELHYKCDK